MSTASPGPADPAGSQPAGDAAFRPTRAVTVRTRLLLALGLVAVLVASPSFYTLFRLEAIGDISRDLRTRYATTSVVLGSLQASLAELDRALRSYVATGDPELRDQVMEAHRAGVRAVTRLEEAGFAEATASARASLDTLATGIGAIDRAIADGRLQEATAILQELKPTLDRDTRDLSAIAAAIDRESATTVARAEATSQATASSLLFSLLISLGLALGVAFWVTHRVSGPLRRLEAATGHVAEGRFEHDGALPVNQQDEIGSLARAFRRMTDRLSELERLRAEFMAAVTHDLKNPINVILGYAQMLGDGVYGTATEEQADAARRIEEQAHTLEDQVAHLTDLSRMEAGGFRIEAGPVETEELLGRAKRSFSALADQRGVRFEVAAEGAPSRFTGDADRLLHEVLANLLANAFKFTDAGGEVVLVAESDRLNGTGPPRAAVRFRVRDTGSGIPDDQIPLVFDRYYQGEGPDRNGSGLGLAIVRQVVEAHDGTVTVESREGEGTTFTVRLPLGGPSSR